MASIRDAKREVGLPHPITERENLEALVPPDDTRPLFMAIRAAFIEKFASYYTALMEVTSGHTSRSACVSSDQLDRLETEWMTWAGLLFSRSNLWAMRDWRKPAIVKFLIRALARPQGGRPSTKLWIALHAKELRLLDPKEWTWKRITAKFCDCGCEHTIKCQDNLRREVLHLEKTLKKYRIALPGKKSP